jgi:DNA-directed RNA polymerase subunit K
MLINPEKKREIEEKYTKYEIARILGARALQVAMNAPMLVKLSDAELKEINYDSLRIAEVEFYSGILPISVKRPLPLRKVEKIKKTNVSKKDLIKQEKAEKKDKKLKKENESERADVKTVQSENLEKKEVVEEDAEIMEMAQPEDELEEAKNESNVEEVEA